MTSAVLPRLPSVWCMTTELGMTVIAPVIRPPTPIRSSGCLGWSVLSTTSSLKNPSGMPDLTLTVSFVPDLI